MSSEYVTLTIPSEALEAAQAAAEREGLSVSAWLSQAAQHAVRECCRPSSPGHDGEAPQHGS